MSLIVCFTWLLLVCHEAETAVTAFGSLKPSNPSFVREGDNITLKWNYTIDGSIGVAQFLNATDDASIAAKFGDGDPTVGPEYQERFKADISNTLAQLTIITVQRSDSGGYKFALTSTKVVAISNEVELKVEYPADITYISRNQTVNENEEVTLNCSGKGMPTPNITWTRVSDNSPVSFPLNINGKQDEGGYKCTADNGIGNPASQVVYVVVKIAPRITNISGNTTVNESDLVALACTADGNPKPNITWTRVSDNSPVSFPLTINGKQDEGGYRCTANNGVKTPDSNVTFITVQYFRPVNTVLNSTDDNIVELNMAFNITCSAEANPPAKYSFYDGGKVISPRNASGNTYTAVVMNRIKKVIYGCLPHNELGNGSFKEVEVSVYYAPSSTNLITVPKNTTLLRESNMSLDCSTDANPDAHIYHFFLNDSPIGNSSSGVFNTTVMVDEVYTCVPINTVGTGDNATVSITVVDPPSIRIHKIKDTVEEGDNITLTCNASGKPQPVITWTKLGSSEVLSKTSSLIIVNVSRPGTPDNMIQYQCTASNGVETPATATVNVTVHYAPSSTKLITVPSNTTLLHKSNISLDCSTDANPDAHIYHFYLNGNLTGNSSSGVFNTTVMADGVYTCVPINTVDTGQNATVSITVVDPPSLTIHKIRDTVEEGDNITLTCHVSGKPQPTTIWTKLNSSVVLSNTSSLTIVNVSRPGTPDNMIQYQCTASNGVETPATATVNVTVHYPPSIRIHKISNTVEEGDSITLTCSASGKPQPTTTWTKLNSSVVLSNTSSLTIVNVSRPGTPDNMIQYQCTASNGVETPATDIATVTVHYAPDRATLTTVPSNRTLLRGSFMTLNCKADASPEAEYHFYFNGESIRNSSSGVFNTTVMADGVYTCVPNNPVSAGEKATVYVTVVVPESNSILVTLTVRNKGCDNNPSEICEQIRKKVEDQIKGDDELKEPKSVTVENCECGSVTAYLSLDFTENVKIPDVISVLKEAAENNGFGGLDVDPGSIQAISEEQLPTDSPSTTVGTTTSEGDKDNGMLWIIIGASVGGAIVLIIVVAVVAWCVHHKRKCRRKGSKVRCSESEAFAPEEGNDYGHANNGYADAGPRPTAMQDMSQHQGASAVPTYAVVDKSAKKASKKDKKVEEEKPQAAPPEYAAVDKSKKKKKEEPEGTYAEVDKSKKSRKKPKPGEVLYADLGDFHQMQELPAVSTSPEALPPIKKPAPYSETQYADITQFLKGNATLPESNNSQGPDTGTQAAPAPEKSNSQEPGTSTKETSQASNPGGDGGPGHETNF